jgi:antitoxin component YwqK of YwqJK toxin-antitoxin module
MQLSQDSSILIYNYYSNGNFIRGVNFKTGTIVYEVKVYDPSYLGGRNGIAQIKTVGNTTYAVGAFKGIIGSDGNIFLRKGFVGFNTYTGLVTAANIQADGFIHFIEKMGNQLIISGKFTEVQGQARNNMAVLDTGTLALLPWSLSPTDMVTALCSYNGKILEKALLLLMPLPIPLHHGTHCHTHL